MSRFAIKCTTILTFVLLVLITITYVHTFQFSRGNLGSLPVTHLLLARGEIMLVRVEKITASLPFYRLQERSYWVARWIRRDVAEALITPQGIITLDDKGFGILPYNGSPFISSYFRPTGEHVELSNISIREMRVRCWPVALLLGIYPALFCHRRVRSSWHKTPDRCPACGYSLIGNLSGACPECGKEMRRSAHVSHGLKWGGLILSFLIAIALVWSRSGQWSHLWNRGLVAIADGRVYFAFQLPESDFFLTAEDRVSFSLIIARLSMPSIWSPSVVSGVVVMPLWIGLLLVAPPTVYLWWIAYRRRVPASHCQHCGYSLTGNTSGVCPECGTVISPASTGPGAS
jgi:predicted RNA-binding Zn-ribbon protein involved in translation (DUF1610 family)